MQALHQPKQLQETEEMVNWTLWFYMGVRAESAIWYVLMGVNSHVPAYRDLWAALNIALCPISFCMSKEQDEYLKS